MSVKQRLEDSKKRRDELVSKIKMIETSRQKLLQEVLRLDGEVRVLESLDKEEEIQ